MKNKPTVLDLFLHNHVIGTLTRLPDDRNIFSFNEEYLHDPMRPTLSLSFNTHMGNIVTRVRPTRTRLQPFFANLLPEGFMRSYLAAHANVHPHREFFLLAALGNDLPGAVRVGQLAPVSGSSLEKANGENRLSPYAMHFSLTGLQLKFSGIWDHKDRLTIPLKGTGGSWIIKLPSPTFKGVPENEYAMMELARQIGINVPKTALVQLDQIKGIPNDIERFGSVAFVIERFDRSEHGDAIHMEDFAQIFNLYPDRKYDTASYGNIAKVLWSEIGEHALTEFIRRLVFNILIGNGDMHLKNWSLIYPDKMHPQLAPAYDYVSTISYLSADKLALSIVGIKSFQGVTLETFEKFAAQLHLPKKPILDTVQDTVDRFSYVWKNSGTLPVEERVSDAISLHLATLPLWGLHT